MDTESFEHAFETMMVDHHDSKQPYPCATRYRVTEFCRPLHQFIMGRRYEGRRGSQWAQLTGTAVHAMVHRAVDKRESPGGWIIDNGRRYSTLFSGVEITGEPDLLVSHVDASADWVIVDLKCGSGYGFGRTEESHRVQLSLYAWLHNQDEQAVADYGEVSSGAILRWARDFSPLRQSKGIQLEPVELMTPGEVEQHIGRYLLRLDLESGVVPEPGNGCSIDERFKFGKSKEGIPHRCAVFCDYAEYCDMAGDKEAEGLRPIRSGL